MSSADEKLKKKAQKNKEDILRYVNKITDYEEQILNEKDEKKIKKYNRAIEDNKTFIKIAAESVGKAGESIEDILPELNSREREIIMEVFPQGINQENLAYAKERRFIIDNIKNDVQKIIKLRKEYSYSDDMPIEEKIKNKLFHKENLLGYSLLDYSNPDSKHYDAAWNYKRDFDNTPEFTDEEREAIQKCVKNAEEKIAYLDVKYAAIRGIGKSMEKAAEKIGDWGEAVADKQVAQEEVKRIKEIFSNILKEQMQTDKKYYSEKELEAMVIKKILDFKDYLLTEKYKEIPALLEQSKTKLQAELGRYPSEEEIEQGLIVLNNGNPDILLYYWTIYNKKDEPYIPTFIKYTNEEVGLSK